jgi:acetylornithine deacetylase/succinyl-diaminopimelate desuccinylase-like protein
VTLVQLVTQLVAIDSVNPTLVTDGPGEREVTDDVARWLTPPDSGDSVIVGPPGAGIHVVDEWVDLEGLARFERILLNVTRSFCG